MDTLLTANATTLALKTIQTCGLDDNTVFYRSILSVSEFGQCWSYLVLKAGDAEVEQIQQAVQLGHGQICEPLL